MSDRQRLTAAGTRSRLLAGVEFGVHLDAHRRRALDDVEELAERDEHQRQDHGGLGG